MAVAYHRSEPPLSGNQHREPYWSEPGLRQSNPRWQVLDSPGNVPRMDELDIIRTGVHDAWARMTSHPLNIGERAKTVTEARKLCATNMELVECMGSIYDLLQFCDRLPTVIRAMIAGHEHVTIQAVRHKD